jgi:hypothetical protein
MANNQSMTSNNAMVEAEDGPIRRHEMSHANDRVQGKGDASTSKQRTFSRSTMLS